MQFLEKNVKVKNININIEHYKINFKNCSNKQMIPYQTKAVNSDPSCLIVQYAIFAIQACQPKHARIFALHTILMIGRELISEVKLNSIPWSLLYRGRILRVPLNFRSL